MNTYALACTCIGRSPWTPGIGRNFIETVLWVTITWSEMEKYIYKLKRCIRGPATQIYHVGVVVKNSMHAYGNSLNDSCLFFKSFSVVPVYLLFCCPTRREELEFQTYCHLNAQIGISPCKKNNRKDNKLKTRFSPVTPLK